MSKIKFWYRIFGCTESWVTESVRWLSQLKSAPRWRLRQQTLCPQLRCWTIFWKPKNVTQKGELPSFFRFSFFWWTFQKKILESKYEAAYRVRLFQKMDKKLPHPVPLLLLPFIPHPTTSFLTAANWVIRSPAGIIGCWHQTFPPIDTRRIL